MSKTKTASKTGAKSASKTASKNNPTAREQAKEYMYNGKKIKPVRLITEKYSFLAAEFDGSGDLVIGVDGQALTWKAATSLSTTAKI